MAGFALLSLDSHHLGKVMSKFEAKSYFYLQQTCKDVNERIQSSRNVYVHMDGHYLYEEHHKGPLQFHSIPSHQKIGVECLRGIRFGSIASPQRNDRFERFYDILKKYQITCVELGMNRTSCTVEQCAALLKLTKPEKVGIDSRKSNRFEALLHSRTVKSIEVTLAKEDVETVVPQLLPAFQEVLIRAKIDLEDFYLFNATLQVLRSSPYPKLRKFRLELDGQWKRTKEKLDNEFQFVDWTVEPEQKERKQYGAVVYLPHQRPGEYSCKLTVLESGTTGAYIDYQFLDSQE